MHSASMRIHVLFFSSGPPQATLFMAAGVDLRDPMFADTTMMTADVFIGPHNSLWQLRHAKFPVIAAVAGPCITGGFELALNCDFIIASKTAFFQDTHSRYGIVPGGGMASVLPRSLGLHAAKWASMVCQRIPAERAFQLGLVAEVRTCTWCMRLRCSAYRRIRGRLHGLLDHSFVTIHLVVTCWLWGVPASWGGGVSHHALGCPAFIATCVLCGCPSIVLSMLLILLELLYQIHLVMLQAWFMCSWWGVLMSSKPQR